MKPWKEMTRIERMRVEYSDLYKDVFGMRPHHIDISAMTDEQLEADWSKLVDLLGENK